jgi:hypothetical protein
LWSRPRPKLGCGAKEGRKEEEEEEEEEEDINAIETNKEALLDADKEIGVDVSTQENKCVCVCVRACAPFHRNAGQHQFNDS